MLISGVVDNAAVEKVGGQGEAVREADDDCQYQTANELFEIMAKDRDLENDEALTQSDLVLLYQNLDLGTQLMANAQELKQRANEPKQRKPNQYVETVIHHDENDTDDSDVSDAQSNIDLQSIIQINKERLNLLNFRQSFSNTLCHKAGDFKIENNDILMKEYKKHCLHKRILKPMKIATGFPEYDSIVLPASLLDYVCYKHLGDDGNLYMDNVIRYVNDTIEQLKRISNGDYLTDKARDKWRHNSRAENEHNMKVLVTSSSIPLHKNRPSTNTGFVNWNSIIHSEVDLRTLCKILEKKITFQIAKPLRGSFKFFKKSSSNLVINCEMKPPPKKGQSVPKLNIVLKLQCTESLHLENKIESSALLLENQEPRVNVVALPYNDETNSTREEKNIEEVASKTKIIELLDTEGLLITDETSDNIEEVPRPEFEIEETVLRAYVNLEYKDKCDAVDDDGKSTIARIMTGISPEVMLSMLTMNKEITVLEGTEEPCGEPQKTLTMNKSLPKVRFKSPYENASILTEEVKKKKALQRKERKNKKATGDSKTSITQKNSNILVQANPNSLTKLTLSNKTNQQKRKPLNRPTKKELKILIPHDDDEDCKYPLIVTTGRDSKRYIDRSYYLDNPVTVIEDMRTQHPENISECSLGSGSYYDAQCASPTKKSEKESRIVDPKENKAPFRRNLNERIENKIEMSKKNRPSFSKKVNPLECRKSIEKIYELLKKLSETDNESKCVEEYREIKEAFSHSKEVFEESLFLETDSGTSVKHHLASGPSSFSFINQEVSRRNPEDCLKNRVSKVDKKLKTDIIQSNNLSKGKSNQRTSIPNSIPGSPLKTIPKKPTDPKRLKSEKKPDKIEPQGTRIISAVFHSRNTRDTIYVDKKPIFAKRPKPPCVIEEKIASTLADKKNSKVMKNNIVDIIDAVKEACGEAVRGPPKHNRSNSLAQHKKSPIQTYNDENHNKQGRATVSDQSKRLRSLSPPELNSRLRNRLQKSLSAKNAPKPIVSQETSPRRTAIVSPEGRTPLSQIRQGSAKKKAVVESAGSTKKSTTQSTMKKRPSLSPEKLSENIQNLSKSRAPLVPDLEMFSLTTTPDEGSSSMGGKLHKIISQVLMDCNEKCQSKRIRENFVDDAMCSELMESLVKEDLVVIKETISASSDFPVDKFADKTVVTVIGDNNEDNVSKTTESDINERITDSKLKEIESLELDVFDKTNTMIDKINKGTFNNTFTSNNSKVTKKLSSSILQSYDSRSVTCMKQSSSKSGTMYDFTALPNLSKTHLNWRVSELLKQVTVGFAIPNYSNGTTEVSARNNAVTQVSTRTSRKLSLKPKYYSSKHTNDTRENKDRKKNIEKPMIIDSGNTSKVLKNLPTTKDEHAATNIKKQNLKQLEVPKIVEIINCNAKTTNSENTGKVLKNSPSTKDEHASTNIKEQKLKQLEVEIINCNAKTTNSASAANPELPKKQMIEKHVDDSSSLDVLMNLLSEIQKITVCQNDMTHITNVPNNSPDKFTIKNIRIGEEISKNTIEIVNTRRNLSLTSIQHVRQLDSSSRVYSFCLSNESKGSSEIQIILPLYADKEVNVAFPEKILATSFTEPLFLPVTVCHSTNVSDSFIGLQKTLRRSKSVFEFESVCSDLARKFSIKDMTDLAKEIPIKDLTSKLINYNEKTKKSCQLISGKLISEELNAVVANKENKNIKMEAENDVMEFPEIKEVMKLKTNVLVTAYTVLVFTVFVALSFPVMGYYQV